MLIIWTPNVKEQQQKNYKEDECVDSLNVN
jgi:hypothetical protein